MSKIVSILWILTQLLESIGWIRILCGDETYTKNMRFVFFPLRGYLLCEITTPSGEKHFRFDRVDDQQVAYQRTEKWLAECLQQWAAAASLRDLRIGMRVIGYWRSNFPKNSEIQEEMDELAQLILAHMRLNMDRFDGVVIEALAS